jgi:hypothetical protein
MTLERLRSEYPIEYCLRAGIEMTPNADRTTYKRNLVGRTLNGEDSDPDAYHVYAMKWGTINEPLALACISSRAARSSPRHHCCYILPGTVVHRRTASSPILRPDCLATSRSSVSKPATTSTRCWCSAGCRRNTSHRCRCRCGRTAATSATFVAYDSRLPDGLKIFIIRVERDDFYIDEVLEPAVRRLLDEVENDFKQFWAKVTERGRAEAKLIVPEFAL